MQMFSATSSLARASIASPFTAVSAMINSTSSCTPFRHPLCLAHFSRKIVYLTNSPMGPLPEKKSAQEIHKHWNRQKTIKNSSQSTRVSSRPVSRAQSFPSQAPFWVRMPPASLTFRCHHCRPETTWRPRKTCSTHILRAGLKSPAFSCIRWDDTNPEVLQSQQLWIKLLFQQTMWTFEWNCFFSN